MFHWICPECGREIAPTIRECPACDPAAAIVETALAGEVEASARAEKEVVAPALSATAPATETKPGAAPYQPIAGVVAVGQEAETVDTTPAPTASVSTASND